MKYSVGLSLQVTRDGGSATTTMQCYVLPVLWMTFWWLININGVWLWRRTVRNDVINHMTVPRNSCQHLYLNFLHLLRSRSSSMHRSCLCTAIVGRRNLPMYWQWIEYTGIKTIKTIGLCYINEKE